MTTSNHTDDDQEMSMDEILASIRRYVSPDDHAPKSTESLIDKQKLVAEPQSSLQRPEPRLDMKAHEDVVRLNENVREETARPATWLDEPSYGSKMSIDNDRVEQRSSRISEKQSNSSSASKVSADGLVSDKTLASTMESFSRLRDASIPRSAPSLEPAASRANPTLDQLFENLARPMIREWLDRNLPPMVERMVTKEIERITKS